RHRRHLSNRRAVQPQLHHLSRSESVMRALAWALVGAATGRALIAQSPGATDRAAQLDIVDLLGSARLPESLTPTFAVSPDGQWVVFVRADGPPQRPSVSAAANPAVTYDISGASLWVVSVKTGELRHLVAPVRSAWAPAWSL